MKFVSKIETEEAFYNAKLKEIIDKYGVKDADGRLVTLEGSVQIAEGMREACKSALAELDAVDVSAPDIKFTLDELSEVKLSAIDMFMLADFIAEE